MVGDDGSVGNKGASLSGQCPECGEAVLLPDDVEPGEIIECENCGVELEVMSLKPAALEIFEEEEK